MVKILLKILGGLLAVLVVAVVGAYIWASVASGRVLSATHETHSVDFPIPFPIPPEEVTSLGLSEEAARELAQQRAIERGKHLVNARYACVECHGQNFGGGVMLDAFPIGSLLGPNLTLGEGSRTLTYTPRDWDRIVRHGVLPDGRPAVMPSEDFQLMSDEELSDIVSYIRTFPPVNNTVPPPSFGPLGKFLIASGQMEPSAAKIASHVSTHPVAPPAAAATVEFGRHIAGTCTGCHGENLAGGPISGGDPAWPPARNLTPHPTALGGWTYEQFVQAFRHGKRPDGTDLRVPMTFISPYAQRMSDAEVQALWAYLRSVPPVASAD
jgi:mono/diheme cytochrome c family protein